MTTQYLIFNAEINEKSANILSSAIAEAINDPSIEDIYFGFSSPGGQVAFGIGAHHAIKSSPKPITMHALGAVDSIAVAIFLAAPKRYAVEGSRFGFHPVTRYVPAGNYNQALLNDHVSLIKDDENRLSGIWQSHLKLEDGELSTLFQGEHPHDCAWALSRGLIERVADFYIPASAIARIRNIS